MARRRASEGNVREISNFKFQQEILESAFDPISLVFLGRENREDDGSLESAVSEFFFPRHLGGVTWMNLREKCLPSFLDLVSDFITEEQRLICINEWVYQKSFVEHAYSPDVTANNNEDTLGLKDAFITVMSAMYERARDSAAMIESEWLLELFQQHLPRMIAFLLEKFPEGPTFHTGHLNYTRIGSNLGYLEVMYFSFLHNRQELTVDLQVFLSKNIFRLLTGK